MWNQGLIFGSRQRVYKYLWVNRPGNSRKKKKPVRDRWIKAGEKRWRSFHRSIWVRDWIWLEKKGCESIEIKDGCWRVKLTGRSGYTNLTVIGYEKSHQSNRHWLQWRWRKENANMTEQYKQKDHFCQINHQLYFRPFQTQVSIMSLFLSIV